ncbi:hypothetical protein [Bradyrhizobium sp. AZCC 2230]|uniref:hypothetical protein n=1 Tax=Bradyrhizobium sp. AZCC 2230 TaxID=3117021 RepID=UPI002FEF8E4D
MFFGIPQLSSPIETLVSVYVRLKNRHALESMRELRRQLLDKLKLASSTNPRTALKHVTDDLRVIEDGLERLGTRTD